MKQNDWLRVFAASPLHNKSHPQRSAPKKAVEGTTKKQNRKQSSQSTTDPNNLLIIKTVGQEGNANNFQSN